MKRLNEAVEGHPDGVLIHIDVAPASSQVEVPASFNVWRGSIEVKLTEKADRGRANRQLIQELAKAFEVSQKDIEIMRGHKSQRKVVLIRGADVESIIAILKRSLGDGA